MAKSEKQSWKDELLDFCSMEPVRVPDAVSETLLRQIHFDLAPPAIGVFGKIAFIQFIVGFATLLFCPQFGVSFTASDGLMPYLMKFGDGACMLGCGAVFTAFALLVTSVVLRPEEIRVWRRYQFLQMLSLASLSLGALICTGGEVVLTLGLIWIIGSVFGGFVALESGWALRQTFAKRGLS